MISSNELTFVVQGPIVYKNNVKIPFSTAECLNSIRRHFPDSPIILSTYEKSTISDCSYDILILNEDPGPCLTSWSDSVLFPSNVNRMIVSSKNGLQMAPTPYSCKTRTDIFFTGNQLLKLNRNYSDHDHDYKFTQERIVVSSLYTKNPRMGKHFLFHISDVLLIGQTSDLLSLFSIPLATPENLFNQYNETYLWHSFIRQKVSPYSNFLEMDEKSFELHEKFLANNVIVHDPSCFQVVFPFQKESYRARLFHQWAIYSHREWQRLYKIHSCKKNTECSIYRYWSFQHYLYKICEALMYPKRWHKILQKKLKYIWVRYFLNTNKTS